jgi:DNA-binding FrmR family transcriptional regulator
VEASSQQQAQYGYLPDKAALLRRLARIEGQVRGIARMIEDERYCIDILTQVSAAGTALDAVGMQVLSDHVGHCVARALAAAEPEESAAKTQELLEAVRRFTRRAVG